eukprot:698787-Alexandrium_andersonii.AAC.1
MWPRSSSKPGVHVPLSRCWLHEACPRRFSQTHSVKQCAHALGQLAEGHAPECTGRVLSRWWS